MDYAGFIDDVRKEKYDLAIIGGCGTNDLKLDRNEFNNPVICYQPQCSLI